MALVAILLRRKLTRGSALSWHLSRDSANVLLLHVSIRQLRAMAQRFNASKFSLAGWGWRLNRAWSGNDLDIFLATHWLAKIMHSATVSWTSRCCLGWMSSKLDLSKSNVTSALSRWSAPPLSRDFWMIFATLKEKNRAVSLDQYGYFYNVAISLDEKSTWTKEEVIPSTVRNPSRQICHLWAKVRVLVTWPRPGPFRLWYPEQLRT